MSPEEREAFEQAKQRAKDLFREHYFTVQPEDPEPPANGIEDS